MKTDIQLQKECRERVYFQVGRQSNHVEIQIGTQLWVSGQIYSRVQEQVFHQLQNQVREQIMGYVLNLAENQEREQGPGWNRMRWKVYA